MTKIDLTPTWSKLLPVMLRILEGDHPEAAKAPLRAELYRLAAFADKINSEGADTPGAEQSP